MVGCVGYGRAIARKCVSAIRKWVPELGIVAITGITKPEYAVEYLLLGADIVEISSGIWYYGADIIESTIRFLERYMATCGYQTIEEFRGLALKHTVWEASKYDFRYGELVAEVDTEKCNGCGRCVTTVCFALDIVRGKAKVNDEYCVGCGLCEAICPRNAVRVIPRKVPKTLNIAAELAGKV